MSKINAWSYFFRLGAHLIKSHIVSLPNSVIKDKTHLILPSFIILHRLLVFLQAYGKFGDGDQRIFTICMHIIRVLLTTPEEDSCFSDEVLGYFTQLDAMAIFLSM